MHCEGKRNHHTGVGSEMLLPVRTPCCREHISAVSQDPPSTFAVHGDWLVSYNDEMAVGICFTDPLYKPELEVLRLLSGVDFYWIETPYYEL